MKQIKWFERKFDFSFEENIFPTILERLSDTSLQLASEVEQLPHALLEAKQDGKWSIKENIGHLIDLEPIWQGRLDDIKGNKKYLRSADLENKKTDLAQHNETGIEELLSQFQRARELSLEKLSVLNESDVYKTALHPRLEQPMRIMDLFLFVAEHDDHHLERIKEVKAN